MKLRMPGPRARGSTRRAGAAAPPPASPGYWALRMLQAAVRGDTVGTLRPAGVLMGLAVVFGAFALYRLARGWGRSHLL